MTTQGVILIDLLGFGLIVLLLNLVRMQKLYVGYAAIWIMAVTGLIVIISVPALLNLVTGAVGARFPVSALSLLAFVMIFVVLIAFSVQLSTLSSRQVKLIQALAIRELEEREARAEHSEGES